MNGKLKILIVEDELLIAEMLKEMIKEIGHEIIGLAKTYNGALEVLTSKEIDLVFLDINLSQEKNGIDIGQKILHDFNLPFVYLTSYSDVETIKKAANTQPEGYLIKPFKQVEILAVIETFLAKRTLQNHSLIIKDGHLQVKLYSEDICYVESENNYITIFTKEKKFTIRQSLEGFLEGLNDSNIIRIHRSYSVNLKYVTAVNGQYVVINDEKIPLSRKYRNEVLALFSK